MLRENGAFGRFTERQCGRTCAALRTARMLMRTSFSPSISQDGGLSSFIFRTLSGEPNSSIVRVFEALNVVALNGKRMGPGARSPRANTLAASICILYNWVKRIRARS